MSSTITNNIHRPEEWDDNLQAVRYGGKIFLFDAEEIAVARNEGIAEAVSFQGTSETARRLLEQSAENPDKLSSPCRFVFSGQQIS
jgi:hypothetical protein